jgi:drug/metabolite transporter (DMT)-like permease
MFESDLIYKILGSTAALISACAWAYSSILFRNLGKTMPASGMNLVKCLIGILLLGFILMVKGFGPVDIRTFLFLGLSGLLGIAFGDTLFFKALGYLSPRLTLLLGTLGPAITVLLAVIFLGERPSLLTWLGMIIIVTGVSWVLWERLPITVVKKNHILGIKLGLLSTLCISIGIILAKIGVASVSSLQATFVRFLWAAAWLAVWGGSSRRLKGWFTATKDTRVFALMLSAVSIAVVGGFWMFQLSLKYIDASIAVVLNSTAPLFIIPMELFFLKEKISFRAAIGAAVSVAGVILVFLR